MISVTAKSPTKRTMISNPDIKLKLPNVNLEIASMGAIPTKEIAIPNNPARSPRIRESPDKLAIIESEKIAIEKYSTGVNFNVKAAK